MLQSLFTPDTLVLIGLAIILAYFGSRIMKTVGIPQILGFMVTGLFLGLIGWLDTPTRLSLTPLVDIALGLIGYNIGLEIKKEAFSGKIRRMSIILLAESVLTFTVVTILTTLVVGQWQIGIVFGAVASATDPASTVMVIWERRCEGNLTNILMYILAMDDIIAIILADISVTIAMLFYAAPGTLTMSMAAISTSYKILASCAGGAILGAFMVFFVNREEDRREVLDLEIGMIIVLVGVMSWLHLSPILSSMVFGFVVVNYVKEEREPVCHTLKVVMSPIVMIFFVIVGASIDISVILQYSVVLLAGAYIIGRTLAKYLGARAGAAVTRTESLTTKYLGLCLMSQAGVAVGLSLIVEQNFLTLGVPEAEYFGILILNVVALTTMVLQVIGPIAASEGLRRAGEFPDDLCDEEEDTRDTPGEGSKINEEESAQE